MVIPVAFLVSIGISFFGITLAIVCWVLLVVGDFVLLRILGSNHYP